MTELQALNLMLLTAGELEVTDINDPNASFAKPPLAFAIAELPYDSSDFALDFESLPSLIQTYVLTRATRKFQLSVVGSAEFLVYSEVDELLSKKNIVASGLIPNSMLKRTQDKLQAQFGFAIDATVTSSGFYPFVLLQATYDFQKAWLAADYIVVTPEEIAIAEEDFRVSLIASRILPDKLVDQVARQFMSTYGFTFTQVTSDILTHIKLVAAYKLQPSIIRTPERYVIKPQEIDNSEASLLTRFVLPNQLVQAQIIVAQAELGIADGVVLTTSFLRYVEIKVAERWQYSVIKYASKMPFTERDVLQAKAKAINSFANASMLDNVSVSRVIDRENTPEITTVGTTEEVV